MPGVSRGLSRGRRGVRSGGPPRTSRQTSAIGPQDRSQGLLRSEQRLDRCDSHQVLHGIGELPVERDQSVGLELGQGDVLGVKRVRPPELVSDLPCDVLEDAVLRAAGSASRARSRGVARRPSWSSHCGIPPGRGATASESEEAPEPAYDVRRESRPRHRLGEWRRPDRSRTSSWKVSCFPLLRGTSACLRLRRCRARSSAMPGASRSLSRRRRSIISWRVRIASSCT